jgi:hypothetical protein
MKPLANPQLYPRPWDSPRPKPEGRCCTAIAEAEHVGCIYFDRGRGAFTILDPRYIVMTAMGGWLPSARTMISFCPFCGFQWSALAPEVAVLTHGARPILPPAPAPRPTWTKPHMAELDLRLMLRPLQRPENPS